MISNVIASYNRKDRLLEHLQALCQQTVGCDAFEVIVVDDGSSDGTPQALRALVGTMPYTLRYYWQPDTGYRLARCRNLGVQLAQHDVIIFNDDDVTPEPECFERYAHTVHAGIAVAGVERHHIADSIMRPDKPWLACIFTNLALHRSDFLRAGRFDEGIPTYGWEDIDLAVRLALSGVQLVQRLDAVANHVNDPYTINPLTAEDKRRLGQTAWDYLVTQYAQRGMVWDDFILESARD